MPGAMSFCLSFASAFSDLSEAAGSVPCCRSGSPVDKHLPGNGLALGAVHEFMEAGAASEHSACVALFAAGILARLKGPVLRRRYAAEIAA